MAPPITCIALWIDCFFHFVATVFFLSSGNAACAATPAAIGITEVLGDSSKTGETYVCVMGFHLYGILRLIVSLQSLSLTTLKGVDGTSTRRCLLSIAIGLYHVVTAQYVVQGIVGEALKDSSIVLHGFLAFILLAAPVVEFFLSGKGTTATTSKKD